MQISGGESSKREADGTNPRQKHLGLKGEVRVGRKGGGAEQERLQRCAGGQLNRKPEEGVWFGLVFL